MQHQHVNPAGLLKLDGFTQVVVASGKRTAYIAGQVAVDEHMNLTGKGDYFEQSVSALRNLATAVKAVGGTPEQIVTSTVYLKELTLEVTGLFTRALAVALDGAAFPAHAFSLIGVHSLASPDLLVEISAVAVFD